MPRAFFFGGAIGLAILAASIARSWLAQRAAAPGPVDRISCPKFIPIIPILIGLFFVVGSIHAFWVDPRSVGLLIFVPGAALVLPFASLLLRSEVRLADGVLTGPAGPWPLTLFERHAINIADIVGVGVTKSGYTYYEAHDGRRVYVSNGYPGSAAFNEALKSACAAPP